MAALSEMQRVLNLVLGRLRRGRYGAALGRVRLLDGCLRRRLVALGWCRLSGVIRGMNILQWGLVCVSWRCLVLLAKLIWINGVLAVSASPVEIDSGECGLLLQTLVRELGGGVNHGGKLPV